MDINKVIDDFQSAMLIQGFNPPESIICDGEIHRFHINNHKRGTANGWYVLFIGEFCTGVFGDWRTNQKCFWSLKNTRCMSMKERAEYKRYMNSIKRLYNEKKLIEQQEASILAEKKWNSYSAARFDHAYLVSKKIAPFYARQTAKLIVLPIVDIQNKLRSLQYISEGGTKRFLWKGAIQGNFIPVNNFLINTKEILICEGFATGATLAQLEPRFCVIASCNAGNLQPVAHNVRKKFPQAKIIICADDDRLNPDNPGLKHGRLAAIRSGSLLAKPQWPKMAPQHLSDFNDLACWSQNEGIAYV
ncbi:toprim domain-containing protein [Legionella pneumophila]|uniref:toprim domain-containing protein n=1 Tax=Legionella pneumophila TaxID=446 RepID=UPI001021BD70|nr:toprim domain-containing protein [Legionella pneumophila]RYW92014.1 toprim domain-containing protein [Legionella pneumophila]HAT1775835.1 toprim domain-containing protein [Legionella pneumophila]HAT1778291.1 toprim domain-containing protein [Legionella pneumophila]HAT2018669.1 toprim domain-containing protein [Legionella pneumophila]HAT2024598.1 toprim domain-containing protein [Legionella pneumophila]